MNSSRKHHRDHSQSRRQGALRRLHSGTGFLGVRALEVRFGSCRGRRGRCGLGGRVRRPAGRPVEPVGAGGAAADM